MTRRTLSVLLSLAAAAAGPAAVTAAMLAVATPALAGPARAGTASVVIDSMSPQTARPGSTVTVAGTVSNETGQTEAGLNVQLLTSPTRFATRDAMDGYLLQSAGVNLEQAGGPFIIATSLKPGATVQWHASFQVDAVGMDEFGVYPVTAQLADLQGDVLSSDQTLLPFWPGQQAAGLLRPLDISWIWPLIDQPRHEVCAALAAGQPAAGVLADNGLTASLGRNGRLSALLAAGQAHAAANLTWVIDPALLSDVETMTGAYRAGSGTGCTGTTSEPASRTASRWLSALRAATADQPIVITPYANADVSALVHGGLTPDLARAYATGYSVADSVLHGSFGPSIALPPGGTADLSVLTYLATAQHIGTVVLDSSEMPPANSAVFEPDDAVTSISAAGTTMTVLLADHILTGVLAGGDTSSGVLAPGTQFAVSQRFLAETAMIAAEAPHSDRSIVVAPPQDWSPSAGLADQLLAETARAQWLAPTPLDSLGRAADSDRSIVRQPPPASKESPGELDGSYLSTVSTLDDRLGAYQAMLYKPAPSYRRSLDEAAAAAESSAWRGAGMPAGLDLADSLFSYLASEESKVKIIAADQVSMGGASGAVPVNIQNGLPVAIQVKVNASVVNSPGRTSQLTVGHFRSLLVIPPQQTPLVRLPVNSAPQGSTVIRLSLSSADGRPLPFATKSLDVQSTRYGRAILFLIAAAIGVMILTSVSRGVRQWLRPRSHAVSDVDSQDAGPPGSVVTGTSGARNPTEAPDDLADARGWVDDA